MSAQLLWPRSCAASFYNQASPVIIIQPCRKLIQEEKALSRSKHFAYDRGSFLSPLLLHNSDIWIPAGVRVAWDTAKSY